MSIKIITDSTSDINLDLAKELDITIVPLRVIFDEQEYFDGVDITNEQFYEKLVISKNLPTTSQPAPEQYIPYFEEAKAKGDSVIVITISSKLSGTYQSAVIAKDMVEYEDIHIVDSLTVTLGLQLLVRKAITLKNQGMSAEAIAVQLENTKTKVKLYALLESLEYLKKGGRLSGMSAFAGGLLNIKPIIEVRDGEVSLAARARGLSGGYSKLFELITQDKGINRNEEVCIGYSAKKDNMKAFINNYKETLNLHDFIESPIGSVVGTHTGPGVCGFAFFQNE
ncbi:DegV family protein [Anaerocolumna chitinilytica]|uniref:DegV family protein n=1 Tax=Anaerocolumna chitinilytica TaxID=1727145 RepID=A0A7I8DM81_9FIRM|nr:DegV family protein [Anaerocolumna chitinilytica]BCJ99489.1 DegV family protein [Anaerocolumna chitinilytica]